MHFYNEERFLINEYARMISMVVFGPLQHFAISLEKNQYVLKIIMLF